MAEKEEIGRLAEEFESCRKVLLALGDETRQHLVLAMMKIEDCRGDERRCDHHKLCITEVTENESYRSDERTPQCTAI